MTQGEKIMLEELLCELRKLNHNVEKANELLEKLTKPPVTGIEIKPGAPTDQTPVDTDTVTT